MATINYFDGDNRVEKAIEEAGLKTIVDYVEKIIDCLKEHDDIIIEITSEGADIWRPEPILTISEVSDDDFDDDEDLTEDEDVMISNAVFEVFANACENFGNFDSHSKKCKECYQNMPSFNKLCEIEKHS